jgi:hypothetical protein
MALFIFTSEDTKGKILADLQYYGMEALDSNNIHSHLSLFEISKQIQLYRTRIRSLENAALDMQLKVLYSKLAYKCVEHYLLTANTYLPPILSENAKLYGNFQTNLTDQEYDRASGCQPRFCDNKLMKEMCS